MLAAFRHGQGPHNIGDYPHADPGLNETGFTQATEAGDFLGRYLQQTTLPIGKAYSSPMLRAIESAITALSRIGYAGPIILDPNLRERHTGDVHDSGTPLPELKVLLEKKYPHIQFDFSLMPPEDKLWYDEVREPKENLDSRIQQARQKYAPEMNDPETLSVAFGHGGFWRRAIGDERYMENCTALLLNGDGTHEILFTPKTRTVIPADHPNYGLQLIAAPA